MMMGFVGAISASLAVIILISVTSLLAYVDSIAPKVGLNRIDDTHYRLIMGNPFVRNRSVVELTNVIDELERENNMALTAAQPGCNYGFNRSEREMLEIVTYNFVQLKKFYQGGVEVMGVNVTEFDAGINFCQIELRFRKNQV